MNDRARVRPWLVSMLVWAASVAGCGIQPAIDVAIPSGRGVQTANLDDVPLQVFTYRPDGCAVSGILLVFHGLGRNAPGYRDDSIPLGTRLCMVVVAPLFDAVRFPTWRYQHGGVIHEGSIQPIGGRTVDLVPRVVAWVRTREHRPDLPYVMLGHSAGAQFVDRVAAYIQNDAERIVVVNPSTWVRSSLEIAAPYGFGKVYEPAAGRDALRRYLAEPVTVLLGNEDVGSRNLAMGEEAEAQGSTRLERGQNVFREAEAVAQHHGWPFRWRLAIVPGVGHNAAGMFASDQALAALRP